LRAASGTGADEWILNNKYNESEMLLSSLENATHWFVFSHTDGSLVRHSDVYVKE